MFIKTATKELLISHLTSLKASKLKIKTLAKEQTNLNDEEMKFYYTQMQQIYTAIVETTKQIELLEKGVENANKDCTKA